MSVIVMEIVLVQLEPSWTILHALMISPTCCNTLVCTLKTSKFEMKGIWTPSSSSSCAPAKEEAKKSGTLNLTSPWRVTTSTKLVPLVLQSYHE